MPSRNIVDLHLAMRPLARRFVADCKAAGIDVLITCTYRPQAEQTALYAQGRTKPGKVVTWTLRSRHSEVDADGNPASTAFDFVPLRAGKAVWSATDAAWRTAGKVAESLGLEWGGAWPAGKRDMPHVQMPRIGR